MNHSNTSHKLSTDEFVRYLSILQHNVIHTSNFYLFFEYEKTPDWLQMSSITVYENENL